MKNLKLFISSTFLTLTFTSLQPAYGMEEPPVGVPKKSSGIQLAKAADDRLEATVGTGNNVLLKVDVGLESFRKALDEDQVAVFARLFLTDFTYVPTEHPDVRFTIKIDCESTPSTCVLPPKPPSFNSYTQFTDWLNQAYFTNQVKLTYDFQVDVQTLAPSLAQHLFFVPPDGYHFIGTYVVDNTKIMPDAVSPQISYHSQRGDINATTVTLGGVLSLNKKPYPIEDHHQVFPHQKIEEKVLEKDETSQFYHYQWLAKSQTISRLAYKESSSHLLNNWPNLPATEYSVVQKKWGTKENILHMLCFVGSSGEEIDIKSGKVFRIKYPAGKEENIIESIISDSEDNLYIVKYRNLHEEKKREEERLRQISTSLGLINNLQAYDTLIGQTMTVIEKERQNGEHDLRQNEEKRRFYLKTRYPNGTEHYNEKLLAGSRDNDGRFICGTTLWFSYCERYTRQLDEPRYCDECAPIGREINKALKYMKDRELQLVTHKQHAEHLKATIRRLMESYQTQAGVPHPRWEEFSKM